MKGNPILAGGSLKSKPTWWTTSRCSTTSAFFVFDGTSKGANPREKQPTQPFFLVVPLFSRWSHSRRSPMLVLSSKPEEKVVIDGGITITVVEVIGGRVKIGVEAPADVAILRGELVAGREGRTLAASLVTEQGAADHGGAGLRPEAITAAAIEDPRRKLPKIPR
jgi:carbon storage regulator